MLVLKVVVVAVVRILLSLRGRYLIWFWLYELSRFFEIDLTYFESVYLLQVLG